MSPRRFSARAPRLHSFARLAGLCALAALGSVGCGSLEPGTDWVSVSRGDLTLGVEVTGALEAVHSDALGPPLVPAVGEFKLSELAPEGSAVEKGQFVLGFDTSELVRKLEEKRTELASATTEMDKKRSDAALARRNEQLSIAESEGKLRKAQLKAEGSAEITGSIELRVAREDFELAKRELAYQRQKAAETRRQDSDDLAALELRKSEAEARVHEIESALPQMRVQAPHAGTLIYVTSWNNQKKKVGDGVWRGERVLETAALDEMLARGQVDEVDVSRIAVGQRVGLRLEAYPDVEYTGSVRSIGKLVEREAPDNPRRIVRVEVGIDHTEPLRMRPGMRFRGSAETERVAGAVLIPMGSVFVTEHGPVAYRRTRFGAESVPLELGKSNATYAQVLSGLSEGDEVSKTDLAAAGGGK
jgi:HlyD family secretion protein